MEETTKSLAMLADQIRVDLKRREDSHQDWVEATISLIMHLAEGRAQFSSNGAFSVWLDENGFDDDELSHQNRWGALNIAEQDPECVRLLLERHPRKSLRYLWSNYMQPIMTTTANLMPITHSGNNLSPLTHSGKTAPTELSSAKTSETPAPEPVLVSPMPSKKHPREGVSKLPNATSLIKKHGDAGRIVNSWLELGTPLIVGNGKAPTIKVGYALAKLSKKTIKELARFVSAHSETLPPPRSHTDSISLKTFWQEAPTPLVKRTMATTDECMVLNIIRKWDVLVAPVLEQWRAAGSPTNSDDWYNRTVIERGLKPAPLSPNASALYAKRAAEISEPIERLAKDGHDQWPLPPPEPIKVHGLEIWPTADDRYDWRAAYYGFSLYYAVADITRERRLQTQARVLLNPLGPLLAHINGPVGVVWRKICVQIFDHPDLAADTHGPGKTLQGY